jgi:hypothetical protein
MGALRTSSYQVTQPELVSTRQYPVYRSTGQLKDTEVCQLAGQIGTGHCLSTSSLSTCSQPTSPDVASSARRPWSALSHAQTLASVTSFQAVCASVRNCL